MVKVILEQQLVLANLVGKTQARTYASAAKGALREPSRARSRSKRRNKSANKRVGARSKSTKTSVQNVVAIYPTAEQGSEVTKKVIQSKMSPRNLDIDVKNVRKIRKGRIIVETRTVEDIDKLIAEFKAIDELNSTTQSKYQRNDFLKSCYTESGTCTPRKASRRN